MTSTARVPAQRQNPTSVVRVIHAPRMGYPAEKGGIKTPTCKTETWGTRVEQPSVNSVEPVGSFFGPGVVGVAGVEELEREFGIVRFFLLRGST